MLQFLKKLKLYTKLGPETVHKPLISIHTKIYLWSFVDYQYLKKYFYIWNITLNCCFICKIISRLTLSGNASGYSSNAHNLTPLFHYPLWKIVHDSVPMIMSFKVLKYFSNVKISFFLFAILLWWDLKLNKLMFFIQKILTHTAVVIPRKKYRFVAWLEFAIFGS